MSALRARAGEQLPASGFVDTSGADVELRGRRGPMLVLVGHGKECRGCAEWIVRLARGADRLNQWGASIFVVRPPQGWASLLEHDLPDGVRVVTDQHGALAGRRGSAVSLLVADEWGEIYFAQRAADELELPGIDETDEWLRFVAIQCPECDPVEPPWGSV